MRKVLLFASMVVFTISTPVNAREIVISCGGLDQTGTCKCTNGNKVSTNGQSCYAYDMGGGKIRSQVYKCKPNGKWVKAYDMGGDSCKNNPAACCNPTNK